MKKILIALLCIAMIVAAFAACGKSADKDEKTTENPMTTQTITTDDAVIANNDAIALIQSYSAKELGLTKQDMKDCSFLVNSSGVKHDGQYYVSVIATIKIAHEATTNDQGEEVISYTFDKKGDYLIRYDGKEILAKNGDSDYRKLKVKAVPSTTAHTEKETEKTTKKK